MSNIASLVTQSHAYVRSGYQRVIDAINNRNGTAYTANDIRLVAPTAVYSQHHNTRVHVVGIGQTHGEFPFYYTRATLKKVFGDFIPTLTKLPTHQYFYQLLPELAAKYKIHLTSDDVDNFRLDTLSELTQQGVTTLTIPLRESSYGYIGTVTVEIRAVTNILSQTIHHNQGLLAGVQHDGTRAEAAILYGVRTLWDYGLASAWLGTQHRVGDVIDQPWMVETLNHLIPDTDWHWAINVTQPFNLYGSVIKYFGPNLTQFGLGFTPDDFLILIELSPHCQNLAGHLIIRVPKLILDRYAAEQETPPTPPTELIPPEEMDTIAELAHVLQNNPNIINELQATIAQQQEIIQNLLHQNNLDDITNIFNDIAEDLADGTLDDLNQNP